MTHQTEPLALLRDTEHYLSALHGSVARHDNLAANYGCAGCELRDRIAAALLEITAAVSAAVAPPTNQTALRGRIRLAIARQWLDEMGSDRTVDELDDAEFGEFADAVLAVLPTTDRAAVLREAADALDAGMERFFGEWPDEPRNSPYALGQRDAANELRRMADETATETPPRPSLRERHRAAWHALTPDQQTARLAELDEPAAGARQDGAET